MKFLDEITDDQIRDLIAAGYMTVDDLKSATADELMTNAGLDSDLAQLIAREAPFFYSQRIHDRRKALTRR